MPTFDQSPLKAFVQSPLKARNKSQSVVPIVKVLILAAPGSILPQVGAGRHQYVDQVGVDYTNSVLDARTVYNPNDIELIIVSYISQATYDDYRSWFPNIRRVYWFVSTQESFSSDYPSITGISPDPDTAHDFLRTGTVVTFYTPSGTVFTTGVETHGSTIGGAPIDPPFINASPGSALQDGGLVYAPIRAKSYMGGISVLDGRNWSITTTTDPDTSTFLGGPFSRIAATSDLQHIVGHWPANSVNARVFYNALWTVP